MRIFTGPALLCFLGWVVFPARADESFPSASNLIQRVVARAQLVAQAEQTNHYAYAKRSIVEELDEKERVIKSTEKLYQVTLIGGVPFPRLVKVQGRDLSAEELEKQNQRETAFREKVTRVDFKKKATKREGMATQELVDRFDFKVVRRELVEGRPTWVVTFAAKANAPDKSMEDKVFKHVFGTVWVDEAEAEVAKLDASVRGPIPLGWFGAVGSLKKFQATFQRSRMPDGVWVNRTGTFLVVARQLWNAMRLRTSEESSGFHRE